MNLNLLTDINLYLNKDKNTNSNNKEVTNNHKGSRDNTIHEINEKQKQCIQHIKQ